MGPGAYKRYATLRLFGHGSVVGCPSPCFSISAWAGTQHPEHARALESCVGSGENTEGRVWIEDVGTLRPGWKTRRAGGSCKGGGWTCTTNPSASMLAAITRLNPTRAACGLLLHVPQAYAGATEQHQQALREKRSGLSVACVTLKGRFDKAEIAVNFSLQKRSRG